VGLALVRSASPGINATTAAYIGVTGVDDLYERCAARGAPGRIRSAKPARVLDSSG